jgi:hypothetical protein
VDWGIHSAKGWWTFAGSTTGQGILKSSLAYLIATLATFVGPLADTLGRQDGKHMVATMSVYFHPGRSIGSMHEAVLLAICSVLYASFISFASMATSILFRGWDFRAAGTSSDRSSIGLFVHLF